METTLDIIKRRISEGWGNSIGATGNNGEAETWVIPPERDRKRYWCAQWKREEDNETGITYRYPHWIGEE